VDVSAGVAGDMMLAALLDAGASLEVVQEAVDAVLPGAAALSTAPVLRAGLRGLKLSVAVAEQDQPHRRWHDLRIGLEQAPLADPVRRDALAVFAALAEAESRVHGSAVGDVHFHEVGAVDSVADVVGVCAAIHDLGIDRLAAGPIALGSGQVRTEHGILAVPVPAVLNLVPGWVVSGGGEGELATPTGVALITTLAEQVTAMPPMQVAAVGVGAGTRDPAGRANVVRVVVGEPVAAAAATMLSREVVIEANIDDLDPRVWPSVLAALFAAGALDAWLTPILMKKGRPAHTLHALTPEHHAGTVRRAMITHTSTIGVREIAVRKFALPRTWVPVEIGGAPVRVKVACEDGVILRATPEFDDVHALAERRGLPTQDVLAEVLAAAHASGLVRGKRLPGELDILRTSRRGTTAPSDTAPG
jgi:uncharacterized protein (TIGR00299 family) protein